MFLVFCEQFMNVRNNELPGKLLENVMMFKAKRSKAVSKTVVFNYIFLWIFLHDFTSQSIAGDPSSNNGTTFSSTSW